MIELPNGLASWAPQLAVLPSDLALALAPWVGRLSLAVGPLSSSQLRSTGEPDGYRGLARRGSYERLVATEWGVAELFPDEFLRRAASGEHLFMELARSEPRAALRSIALVSAGPAQLGSPRLAHVAALIVLARRAATAGASFAWGVLEDREHRLYDAIDPTSIHQLLAARTAVVAAPDPIDAWRQAISPEPTLDFWFLGDHERAAGATSAGASCMVVRDVLEPNVRALDVEIERRGRRARVRLELPEPELCARLLRDPFAVGAGAPTRVASVSAAAVGARFAVGGRKLIVQVADGTYEAWPVPSSPRDKLGKPRTWTPPLDHVVLSVGIGRRSILAATATRADPASLELHYGSNTPVRIILPERAAAAVGASFTAGAPPRVGSCAIVETSLAGAQPSLDLEVHGMLLSVPGFALWPAAGTVVESRPDVIKANLPSSRLLAVVFSRQSPTLVEHDDFEVLVSTAATGKVESVPFVTDSMPNEAHIGFSYKHGTSPVVVTTNWHAWVLSERAVKKIAVAVPVRGVWIDQHGATALLTQPDAYRLATFTDGKRDVLTTSNDRIVAVTVCPSYPNVAWITDKGEVVVYSVQYRAVLFRRTPGAPA